MGISETMVCPPQEKRIREMKLLRDKTIGFLDSALAEIQLREWEARNCHEFIFADGLHSAWKFIADMRAEYVNQKAKRNPIFRWAIRRRYKSACKAIREIKL